MKKLHSTTSEKQQSNELQKLCLDVLDYGDLALIASKSHGKTHALMQLARTFKNMENTRVFVFEDFPKWINEFDSIAYFIIRDKDVIETQHTVDLENYFLRHERDYTVRRGREIKEFLKDNKHGIFLMNIKDIERSAFFIYSIVQYFYRKAYLRAFKNYNKHERIVFVIEESQNVFDSSTISKKLFNRLRKIFSVARNLGLHFVICSQRLQDLNTKIRGRTRLMIGQIGLDDYELKIRRLLRHSQFKKEVLALPKGVFLYAKTDSLVSFSKFEQNGTPYQYETKPTPKPQKKEGIVTKVLRAFFCVKDEEEEKPDIPSVYDESQDFDEELEEDLAFLGEPDEEW